MLQGKSFQVLTDNEDPAKSTNTDIVMAWYTLGGKLAPQPFEKVEEDGKLRVSWIIETTTKADINGELIEFGEFQKRWNDLEWCKANEWHAISVMRAFRDNSRDAKRWARQQATGVLKRKGNAICVAYPNSPDWLKKEMARFV
jgi:hypothetical protein